MIPAVSVKTSASTAAFTWDRSTKGPVAADTSDIGMAADRPSPGRAGSVSAYAIDLAEGASPAGGEKRLRGGNRSRLLVAAFSGPHLGAFLFGHAKLPLLRGARLPGKTGGRRPSAETAYLSQIHSTAPFSVRRTGVRPAAPSDRP